MDTRELQTFIVTADEGSISRAAEKLFISSVSVMNRLNSLESTVGVRLFVRTNHGTSLTAAGRAFYKSAQDILALVNRSTRNARKIEEAEQYVIRIGTSVLRPCRDLIDLWEEADDGNQPFRLELVPFSDSKDSLSTLLRQPSPVVDCYLSPCDALQWQEDYNILLLKSLPCRVGVPRKHPLAKKTSLTWDDLRGETLMLIQSGFSPVMKRMNDEIIARHPDVMMSDIPYYYETATFNRCAQMGYVMETLDIWENAHPSIVNLPMEWDYEMPYGIVYAKDPREPVRRFMELVRRVLEKRQREAAR